MSVDPAVLFLERVHGLCEEQAVDLFAVLASLMAADARSNAPASRDHAQLLSSVRSQDRQELWSSVAMGWLHLSVNVADHTRALGLLLTHLDAGAPIYAHTSLARVAVESASTLLYLMDAGGEFEDRLGRGVAFLIVDAELASRAAAKVPGNAVMAAPATAVVGEQTKLRNLIERARIEVVLGRSGSPKGVRVRPGGAEALLSVKATTQVETAFADMPAVYDLFSGVVHGKPWQLGDRARSQGRYATWSADPLDVACAVLAATSAAHRTATAHARYRGHDDDPVAARMLARVGAVDKAMQKFGSVWIGPERLRPSIARFLPPGR
jgi:hypothetical protein